MWYAIKLTGIDPIDAEHRRVDMLLEHARASGGERIPLLKQAMDAFFDHLASEERYCQDHHIAMGEDHIREHLRLREVCGQLIDATHDENVDETIEFLQKMLRDHVLGFDAWLRPGS